MTESPYRRHPVRSIFITMIVCFVVMIIACRLTLFVKLLGAPFLFLPTQLGLIQQAQPADVFGFAMAESPTIWTVDRPGRYVLYSDSDEILTLTDTMANSYSTPWLKVSREPAGEPVTVEYLDRGLLPFDSALVPGRPLLTFTLPAAGTYELVHPRRPLSLWILPDYVTGHEGVIVAAIVLQLAVVTGPFIIVAYRRYHARRVLREAVKRRRRAEVDEFWKKESLRRVDQRNR